MFLHIVHDISDAKYLSVLKIYFFRENLAIPTSLLEELVVYMEVNRRSIVGQFPNFVEKD